MNYITSFFFGSSEQQQQPAEEQKLTEEQEQFIKELQQSNGIFKILSKDYIENFLCIEVENIEFSQIVKNKDKSGQEKKCLILSSKISFRVQEVAEKDMETGEDISITIPFVCVENVEYDADQGHIQEQFLPLSSDLVLLKYKDKDEGKRGYVFFYPSQDKTWLLESDDSNQDQLKELKKWEVAITQVLYTIHKKSDPLQAEKNDYLQYCIETSPKTIFQSKNLYFIFQDPNQKQGNQEEVKSQSTVEDSIIQKTKEIKKEEEKIQNEALVQQLSQIELIESKDQVPFEQVQMLIDERLLQVRGYLYQYNSESDENNLVAINCFLCIDRIHGDSRHQYMFHVTDQQQQVSFTRVQLQKEPALNYSFSELQKMLMWIGKPAENADPGDIPAWTFILEHSDDASRLKGVLTKVIFETNACEDIERACEKGDEQYLEQQIVDDQEVNASMNDIDMSEEQNFNSFEFDDVDFEMTETDLDQIKQNLDESELDSGLDLIEESENSEIVQAHGYDRQFLVQGPIVKVYKRGDEDGEHLKLQQIQNFPLLKNEQNEVITPSNLMLHQNESNLIFTDYNDPSQLFNFDMEHGKIVEQFQADKDQKQSQLRHITNKIKNGQSGSEDVFVGVGERSIYTIDPRINKKDKMAQSKVYKTNPEFSCVSTTFAGGLAIGSLDGSIRLYKEVGQNAKTNLPGLGDPIRAIDMSIDGKWVLATTQTYLLVIPTECKNGSGFEKSMGKEKPIPKKLQLHVKDLAKHRITCVNFTAARFNNFNVSNGEHTSIVTSTGPFLITWNFKKVQRGISKSYQIKKVDQNQSKVVDSQFRFNDDEKILVTQPKAIGVQTRSMAKSGKDYIQY